MSAINQQKLGPRWQEIEESARDLQRQLWLRKNELWESTPPSDEVDLLEPGVALQLLGFEVQSSDFLGEVNHDGVRTEVAGFIDMASKVVQISRRFPRHVQLFTAAHELAHAVLHPSDVTLHRDRPLAGSDQQRDWREREADWFATCFLMPAKLVRARFVQAFCAERFDLTDDTAFSLCSTSFENLLQACKTQRGLSRKLAEANSYGGREIEPLTSIFSVSTTAMAIRLEQLGLVGVMQQGARAPAYLLPA